LAGFAIVTGTGNSNSDIEFAWSTTEAAEFKYAYLNYPNIIAIPLNDLTENTDYWAYEQISDAGDGVTTQIPWQDLTSIDLTGIDAGDYLVLASTEFKCAQSGNVAQVRLQIDGVTQGGEFNQKRTGSQLDNMGAAYARLHTLAAGNHTVTWQGGSHTGNLNKYFHRFKLIIIKAAMWNQMVSVSDDSESSTIFAYPSGAILEQQAITLGTSGYVVGISNMRMWKDGVGASGHQLSKSGGAAQSARLYKVHRGAGENDQNSSTGFYCDNETGTATFDYMGAAPSGCWWRSRRRYRQCGCLR
jgi:hypothetical protein